MSTQQQPKLQECRNCKSNGFPQQQIGFKDSGQKKDDGSIKWTVLNPDGSIHQHKKQAAVTTTTTAPTSLPGLTDLPKVNMSESQKASVEGYNEEKQQYYKERQEDRDAKYDRNIEEYKTHNKVTEQWQDDILREAKYQSTILEDTLTNQKEMANDIKDMLRILSQQTQEPTIQKASELVARTALEKAANENQEKETKQKSQYEKEKAFENLDSAVDELATQIEKEIQQEQQQQQQTRKQQHIPDDLEVDDFAIQVRNEEEQRQKQEDHGFRE